MALVQDSPSGVLIYPKPEILDGTRYRTATCEIIKLVQFLHHPITQCSQQSRHFIDIYRIEYHQMTTLLAPSQFTITLKSARPHTQALQQPQTLCRSCCSHLEVNQTQSSKDAKTKSFKAVSSLFILKFQKNFLFFKVQDQPHLLLVTEKLRE